VRPLVIGLAIALAVGLSCTKREARSKSEAASPLEATPVATLPQTSDAPSPAVDESPEPAASEVPRKVVPVHLGPGIIRPVATYREPLDWKKLQSIRPRSAPIYEAIIGADGSVETIKVIRSAGPEADEVLMSGLRRWRFKPALKEGKPVPAYFTFTFNIDNG
jgi:TonB family protein